MIQNGTTDRSFQQILAFLKLEQRIHSGENQIIPTVLTFLPPIPCSTTKFITVFKTKHRSIHFSTISNMKYTHIALDMGVAEKHFKAIWINPDEFMDLIGYLRNILHDFMHFLVTM